MLSCRLNRCVLALASAVMLSIAVVAPPAKAAESRSASLVIDAATRQVLHARDADSLRYPASLTKIMTLYMIFEALDDGRVGLHDRMAVSRFAEGQAPSRLGVRAGQTIDVEDAILALVTKSANDVAVVIAEHLAESEIRFAVMMTEKARKLGMNRTSFRNASGLPNPNQKTTARDMATLAQALINNHPRWYRYFSRSSFDYEGQQIRSHNRVIARYQGADGIKTGYIHASGFNLVSSAIRNGRRLIGVVFGGTSGKSRDDYMIKLLDQGFAKLGSGPQVLMAEAPLPPGRKPQGDSTTDHVGALLAAVDTASDDLLGEGSQDDPDGVEVASVVGAMAGAVAPASVQAASLRSVVLPSAKPEIRQSRPYGTQRAADPAKNSVKAAPVGRYDWGVQVGAFSRKDQSKAALSKASKRLPRILKARMSEIEKIATKKGPVYRARFGRLDEKSARSACDTLRSKGQNCLVVPPS